VSWLVAIGCVLILLATVGSQFLFGGVFRWLSEQDWLPGRMEYKLFAVSLATGLPVTLAYLLFLLAAFADRPADDFKEEG
jgi:ribose/xylose/arabinose/galactoside ABC-type transport system permease subunit